MVVGFDHGLIYVKHYDIHPVVSAYACLCQEEEKDEKDEKDEKTEKDEKSAPCFRRSMVFNWLRCIPEWLWFGDVNYRCMSVFCFISLSKEV